MSIHRSVFSLLVCCAAIAPGSCSDPEAEIRKAVGEAASQCPVELEAGMVLTGIDITDDGDVRFRMQAPAYMVDSAIVARTLAGKEFQGYWLDLMLPREPNERFIDAVKESGHHFVFSVLTGDSCLVEQAVEPR